MKHQFFSSEEFVQGSNRRAWRITEARHINSRLREEDELWTIEYLIRITSFTLRLYVRIEYSSLRMALRSLESARKKGASFIGTKIIGAWPLHLNISAERIQEENKKLLCRPGESFAGSGRWEEMQFFPSKDQGRRILQWKPDACEPLRPRIKEARLCIRQLGGLLITIGDSVARQLSAAMAIQNFPIKHFHVKGPVPKHLDKMFSIIDQLVRNETKFPIFLNPAGLWQSAYGNIDDYAYALNALLERARPLPNLILVLTTAVHPIHFLKFFDALSDTPRLLNNSIWQAHTKQQFKYSRHNVTLEARRKRAMTLPRVHAIVTFEKQLAASYGRSVLDFYHPTLGREDDPVEPTDMRHYGISTLTELRNLLMAFICDLALSKNKVNFISQDEAALTRLSIRRFFLGRLKARRGTKSKNFKRRHTLHSYIENKHFNPFTLSSSRRSGTVHFSSPQQVNNKPSRALALSSSSS